MRAWKNGGGAVRQRGGQGGDVSIRVLIVARRPIGADDFGFESGEDIEVVHFARSALSLDESADDVDVGIVDIDFRVSRPSSFTSSIRGQCSLYLSASVTKSAWPYMSSSLASRRLSCAST